MPLPYTPELQEDLGLVEGVVGRFDACFPLLSNDILKSESSESFLSPVKNLIKVPETGPPERPLACDPAGEIQCSLMRPCRLAALTWGSIEGHQGVC